MNPSEKQRRAGASPAKAARKRSAPLKEKADGRPAPAISEEKALFYGALTESKGFSIEDAESFFLKK